MCHPDVVEVVVVGIADARTGERACAVVLRDGAALALGGLVAYLKKTRRLAAFKIPERIEVCAGLPKNAAGKIVKRDIAAALQ